MEKKSTFIVTKDKETATKLISAGLRLVTEINGTYTFENKSNDVMTFDKVDKTKVVYSNVLTI